MNDLRPLWLPLSLAGLAVLVLLLDLLGPAHGSKPPGRGTGVLTAAGLAGLLAATFLVDGTGSAASGAFQGSAWSLFFQRLFLAAGLLGALGGLDDVARRTARRQGEYWLLLLLCLTGMVLLAGASDLVLLVVSFELMGLPLYVLAAYAKTEVDDEALRTRASEASLKLYLVGATSTAFTLFGLALLTGMAGTTRLATLGAAPLTPLSAVGLVFVLGGLGYKIGMVPFHMWVPDTYQGARLPFVAFLSVAPKAAGISVLASIFLFGMGAHRGHWVPPLSMMALLSMGVGNLLALPQTDLRRLFGYSGIAQMGYVLVAVAAGDAFGASMTLFFLTAYVFTNLGALLVMHAASESSGGFDEEALAGLWKRAPGLAVALACFLLSLAGIPFMVGFWAKFYVFLAAWRAGLVGLVAAAIVLAVMGLFYYLRVLRAAYMSEPGELHTPAPGLALGLAIGLCVLAVVALGLWPGPLVDSATRAGADFVSLSASPAPAAR